MSNKEKMSGASKENTEEEIEGLTAENFEDRSEKLDSKNSVSPDELMHILQNKQSDSYRFLKFHVSSPKSKYEKMYKKRVSFDTINIQYAEDSDGVDSDEDDYQFLTFDRSRGRGRNRSPSPHHRSPLNSPSPTAKRPIFANEMTDISKLLTPSKLAYPTRPIITHKGCTYNKIHQKFEDLCIGRLYNQKNNWKKPVLPGRTILVYISARKHTWVALDWILRDYIEHGDSVVIVSGINTRTTSFSKRSPSNVGHIKTKTPAMRLRQRSSPEYANILAQNIMSYALSVINKDIIARVSVELALGQSKAVLKDMYKLYQPNLVCTGTKPNFSTSAPLKSWNSSKLIDRLVKNFPLPVIVVPAMNMNKFERRLAKELNPCNQAKPASIPSAIGGSDSSGESFSKEEDENENSDMSSISSASSASSQGSVSSEDSYSSFVEITKLYGGYKKDMKKNMENLSEVSYHEEYFSNFMKSISDASLAFCQELRSIDPDFRGKGAKLARAITGSNSFGVVPFKTKSLLDPVKTESSSSSAPSGGLSYKDLKKNLKINATTQAPKIEISSPGSTSPKKTSLRFGNLKSPERNSNQKSNSKALKKSLSHDMDASQMRPKLEPLKSHPDMRIFHSTSDLPDILDNSGDKKKIKKKKGFWKLFK